MDKAENATRESHLRSLLKGLSWRMLATLTTVLVACFILRERENTLRKALSIGTVRKIVGVG